MTPGGRDRRPPLTRVPVPVPAPSPPPRRKRPRPSGGFGARSAAMSRPGAADPGAAVEQLCRELNLDAASAAEALRDFTALHGTYSLEVRGAGAGTGTGTGRGRARSRPGRARGARRCPVTAALPVPSGRSAALAGLCPVRRLPPEPRAHRGEQPDGGERRLPDPHPALRPPQVSAPSAGPALPKALTRASLLRSSAPSRGGVKAVNPLLLQIEVRCKYVISSFESLGNHPCRIGSCCTRAVCFSL